VIGELAGLDQRLKAQLDQSAEVVTTGRSGVDAVRKWVVDAAASVPQDAADERMLLPIVQKGIGEVLGIVQRSNGELNIIGATIRGLGDEYRALGDQKLGKRDGDPQFIGGEKDDEDEDDYEKALRDAGLLTGPPPAGYYKEWLKTAERQGVPPQVIVDIARRHAITPEDFEVLNGMEKVTDEDGKSFFLMPSGTKRDDARKAALMTYILNAGTDYGEGTPRDFPPTPYSADEIQRIIDRQEANSWSYDRDVDFVHDNGGRLMTTPNGMLMGLGGNWVQDFFSEAGGSTWGDIFMFNIDDPDDPAQRLRSIAQSGVMWYPQADGNGYRYDAVDLDRVLHHEERHSQQWAEKGHGTMLREYGIEWAREQIGLPNRLEEDAGLSDGGYR
jgi:hypothetical protein